jgi:hypothetical protein
MTQVQDQFVTAESNDDFSVDLIESAAAEQGLNSAFSGVLQAYRDEGFAAGYARASSDLLADFVLIAEQFIHEQPPEQRSVLRPVLRAFENRVAMAVGSRRAVEVFVDGGLGI